MTSTDRVLIDVKMLLNRRVLVQGPDGTMVQDDSWPLKIRALYSSIYNYLKSRNLLSERHVAPDHIDGLLLRESDLHPLALVI